MITIKTDIKETAANPKSGALGASKGSNSTASSISTKQKQDNKGNEGAQSNILIYYTYYINKSIKLSSWGQYLHFHQLACYKRAICIDFV